MFLADENVVFSIALCLLLLIALAQLLGVGDVIGDGDTDLGAGDLDAGGDLGMVDGLLTYIGIGRMPFLMWLALLLAMFGLLGLIGQQVAAALTGHLLAPWIAVPVAGVIAFVVTGLLSHPIGRILPRDETTAVDIDTLVGRSGEIVVGRACVGSAARAAVRDGHGHTHFVMVEPNDPAETIGAGERVLLVRREGDVFRGIGAGDATLRLD